MSTESITINAPYNVTNQVYSQAANGLVEMTTILFQEQTITAEKLLNIARKKWPQSLQGSPEANLLSSQDMGIVIETIKYCGNNLRHNIPLSGEHKKMFDIALDIAFVRAISHTPPLLNVLESTNNPELGAKYGYSFFDSRHFSSVKCSHEFFDVVTEFMADLILGGKQDLAAGYLKLFTFATYMSQDRYTNKYPAAAELAVGMLPTPIEHPWEMHEAGIKYLKESISEYRDVYARKYETPSPTEQAFEGFLCIHNTSCVGLLTAILKGPHSINQLHSSAWQDKTLKQNGETIQIFAGPEVSFEGKALKTIQELRTLNLPQAFIGFGYTIGGLTKEQTIAMATKVLDNIRIIYSAQDQSGQKIFVKPFSDLLAYYTKGMDQSLLFEMIMDTADATTALEIAADVLQDQKEGRVVDEKVKKALQFAAIAAVDENTARDLGINLDEDTIVNTKDNQGRTAAHVVAEQGKTVELEKLLKIAPTVAQVEDSQGNTPGQSLLKACEHSTIPSHLAKTLNIPFHLEDNIDAPSNPGSIDLLLSSGLPEKLEALRPQDDLDGDLSIAFDEVSSNFRIFLSHLTSKLIAAKSQMQGLFDQAVALVTNYNVGDGITEDQDALPALQELAQKFKDTVEAWKTPLRLSEEEVDPSFVDAAFNGYLNDKIQEIPEVENSFNREEFTEIVLKLCNVLNSTFEDLRVESAFIVGGMISQEATADLTNFIASASEGSYFENAFYSHVIGLNASVFDII